MKAEQDAVVAALKAAWPAGRVYNVGEVPDTPQTPYMVVSVASGEPRNYRAGSRTASRFTRAVVQTFGRNFSEVAFAERADTALLDKRVFATATPCRKETSSPVTRDPDDGGLLMSVATYTFTTPA